MAYARTTISEFRSLLTERLGGNETFWNQGEIDSALNEALAVWQLITGDVVGTYNQALAAGSQVVAWSNTSTPSMGFIRLRRMTTTATPSPSTTLYPISIQEMDQGYYGRQGSASGTPEYWAPFGIDKFVVYPAATTTATVQVQYFAADTRLVMDGATYVDLGDEEILRIIDYAQWVLSFKEGLKEALVNTSPMRDMFLTAAKLRSAKLRGTSLYRNYMGNDRDEQKPGRTNDEQTGLRG
jgi:hypothetical protein